MRLIVDSNILVRCVIGSAFRHVAALVARDIVLTTAERQVDETLGVLVGKLKLPRPLAEAQLFEVLRPFEILALDTYAADSDEARSRLREGAGNDWHCLAASMTLNADIWSEDSDFFGTGAAVWSTRNLDFVEP